MRGAPATALRAAAGLLAAALAVIVVPPAADAAVAREKWDTRVFARVQPPGFPAYAYRHTNRRVYVGSYTNPAGDHARSRIFEYAGNGTLLRSWAMPGQDLSVDHGVQVATQDASGRLVLLEKSTASVWTLEPGSGRFRRWATIPDLPICSSGETPCSPNVTDSPAIPNLAAWGPRGNLFVTDYGQAVVWRIAPAHPFRPRPWFRSAALDGSEFGTAGIQYRPGRGDLLIAQQSTTTQASVPADGKLYRLPVTGRVRPGRLSTLWTSQPGELPDGFGLARSGRIYVANAGTSAQLVVLGAGGAELDRFPDVPVTGENGSPIPFDTPSSATFHGRRLLVANQAFTGDRDHHAILDVWVGEVGRPVFVPPSARWHR